MDPYSETVNGQPVTHVPVERLNQANHLVRELMAEREILRAKVHDLEDEITRQKEHAEKRAKIFTLIAMLLDDAENAS